MEHMVSRQKYFNELKSVQGATKVGDQEIMKSEGLGTARAIAVVDRIEKKLILHDVLYGPGLL